MHFYKHIHEIALSYSASMEKPESGIRNPELEPEVEMELEPELEPQPKK